MAESNYKFVLQLLADMNPNNFIRMWASRETDN